MDLGLAGKTVTVVGGSSNLGRACCLAFAKEGSNVVVAARHIQDCHKVVDKCNAMEGRGTAIAISADATKLDQCEELVRRTLERFKRIDCLVISLGWTRLGHFLDLGPEDWELMIATNYWATLTLLKTLLPVMIEQKGGNIVTVSSVIGRRGDPHEPVYGGCKAAQITLTHGLAMEMAKYGIRLNVVAPAMTMPESPDEIGVDSLWSATVKGALSPETKQTMIKDFESKTPMGKIAKSIDVAHAVLFFASDVMSGHVTGNVIGTDGGMYMGH
jgi:NAD(P)-dependent dehydrogenase (short-subunit alcohol dehydrogenase family)